MTKSIKYMGVSGKYTKNGTPRCFTSITPFITVKNPPATVIKDHGAVRYNMNFVNKVETEEGKIK